MFSHWAKTLLFGLSDIALTIKKKVSVEKLMLTQNILPKLNSDYETLMDKQLNLFIKFGLLDKQVTRGAVKDF